MGTLPLRFQPNYKNGELSSLLLCKSLHFKITAHDKRLRIALNEEALRKVADSLFNSKLR